MLDVLRHPFPHLTSLTLCLERSGLGNVTAGDIPETLFRGELPQLQRLSLWFYTSWFHHKFPNLTHISLHNQYIRPSIDGFLDLLESTPCLEFLFLDEAGPRIAQGDILPQRRVSLPSLRSVQFTTQSAVNEPHNVRILQCLTTRHLTRCFVLCNDRFRLTPDRPPFSPGVVESIFTHIKPEGIIELCVYQYNSYAYGLGVDASTRRISIQTMPYGLVTVPSPRCSSIKHLHLVSTVGIFKVDWDSFSSLLSITCYGSLNGINSLVFSLSQKIKTGCACPLLKTIYLRVGEQPPDPMHLDTRWDGDLVQRVLDCFPEPTVIHKNQGNSYQIALELRQAFPEEFQMEALETFPLN